MADESIPRSGIYCIRNIVSGRIYIGLASYIKSRWSTHRQCLRAGNHHSIRLQRSWNKHGASAFRFEVLEAVAEIAELLPREQHWIDLLHASCPIRGFNVSRKAGSPMLGRTHSPEARKMMSASRKGKKLRPRTAEHSANISAGKTGKQQTKPRQKGYRLPAETCAKMSATRTGKKRKPFTAEHRAKISAHRRRRSTGDLTNQIKLL